MPKVVVTLQHVQCHVTEDDAGPDEIYVVAAHHSSLEQLTPDKTDQIRRHPKKETIPNPLTGTTLVKAPTQSMNNGQSWTPMAEILSATVGYGPLEVGVWLFDQDAAESVDTEDVEAVAKAVNTAGAALAPITEGMGPLVAWTLEFLIRLTGALIELDKDDLLGYEPFKVTLLPTAGQPPAMIQMLKQTVYKTHFCRLSATNYGANYDVYFMITITE